MSSVRVRLIRRDFRWTQAELGEYVGYGRWAVAQWEAGAQPVPAAVALLLEIWHENPQLLRKPSELTGYH